MKINITDPNGKEHDLDNVILEFAHLHNVIGARLTAIESFLGLNQEPTEESKDSE